jgi:fatty acid desaturase
MPKDAVKYRDYTVGGPESELARKKGLASGQWFVPHIERKTLRRLMKRDDYHASRDCAILLGILLTTALTSCYFWQREEYYLFSFTFWVYCTFYTSCADSRWHECGHATAFKTKWMNDFVYNIASFMVFREPLVWRFSHARHHTDTDIVGRDPEIDGRPLDMWNLFLAFFNVQGIQSESRKLWQHANGSLSPSERHFVPSNESGNIFNQARVFLGIYALALFASFHFKSPLPAMFIFLPYTLGAWHFVLTGVFQHASLEHDVLDHRLNTRTCYINPISAFIYWNMQYHVEHHTFPMVPYYNLPELHKELQKGGQMPKPYR